MSNWRTEPNISSGSFKRPAFAPAEEARMKLWTTTLTALVVIGCSSALPAIASQGTAKEQAACRPDVRRFCSSIKPGSDDGMFLSCLEANRGKLSKACRGVLESHGM